MLYIIYITDVIIIQVIVFFIHFVCFKYYSIKANFYFYYYWGFLVLESVCEHGKGRGRGRATESKTGSILSTEPNSGLSPTTLQS